MGRAPSDDAEPTDEAPTIVRGEPIADTLGDRDTAQSEPAARMASRRSQPVLPGGRTIGRYVLGPLLGKGGMGSVYKAFDPQLDRDVAIKLVRRTGDAEAQQLIREARAIARVQHPNVVTVYDAGLDAGQVFIAMELVLGGTLEAWCRAGPRSADDVVRMFVATGRGLEAAHAAGMIHRDFKPANVLVGHDGRPRVSDFGLAVVAAKAVAVEQAVAFATTQWVPTPNGPIVGTPAYMAPEQSEGAGVDARADQFAFAVALYEALEGERPFTGPTIAAIRAAIIDGPRPMRSSSRRWVGSTLTRALAENPAARFPSMTVLLAALRRRRRRWIVPAIALTLAAGAGTVALAWPRDTPTAVVTCDGATAPLEAVWQPGVAEQVRQAMRGVDSPGAAETAERAIQGLDGYARRWRTARTASCQASMIDGAITRDQADRQVECLTSALRRLRNAVEVFTHPDVPTLQAAPRVVAGLPALETCDNFTALGERVPLPQDVATRTRVMELNELADRAATWVRAGRYAEARDLLDTVQAEVATVGYRPLEASVELSRADLAYRAGDIPASLAASNRAALAATAGRDDALALEAFARTARTQVIANSDLAAARHALAQARASAERGGLLERARRELDPIEGMILRDEGDFDGADRMFRKADESLGRATSDQVVERGALAVDHAVVLARLGRQQEALARMDDALRHLRAGYGEQHPMYANALLADASMARDRLEPTRAQASVDAAAAILAKYPDALPLQAMLAGEQARIKTVRGDVRGAQALFARAVELMSQVAGASSSRVAELLRSQAVALDTHDPKEAMRLLERAKAIYAANGGADSYEVIDTEVLIPDLMVAMGQYREAVVRVDALLARVARIHGATSLLYAQVLYARATVHDEGKQLTDAARDYQACLQLAIQHQTDGEALAISARTELAAVLVRAAQPAAAIDAVGPWLADMAARSPTGAELRMSRILADAYLARGAPADALVVLDRALAEPGYASREQARWLARIERARVLFLLQRRQDARVELEAVLPMVEAQREPWAPEEARLVQAGQKLLRSLRGA